MDLVELFEEQSFISFVKSDKYLVLNLIKYSKSSDDLKKMYINPVFWCNIMVNVRWTKLPQLLYIYRNDIDGLIDACNDENIEKTAESIEREFELA